MRLIKINDAVHRDLIERSSSMHSSNNKEKYHKWKMMMIRKKYSAVNVSWLIAFVWCCSFKYTTKVQNQCLLNFSVSTSMRLYMCCKNKIIEFLQVEKGFKVYEYKKSISAHCCSKQSNSLKCLTWLFYFVLLFVHPELLVLLSFNDYVSRERKIRNII